MAVHNQEVADIFDRYATLLEIEGANRFRVRAYRNAARTIQDLPRTLGAMLAEGEDLSKLPGIGKELAQKIAQIVETGHLTQLEELERRTPGDLATLTALPGLGPKRVRALYERLRIDSMDRLADAAENGRIRELPGFGAATEQRIVREIERWRKAQGRIRWRAAEEVAEPLLRYLQDSEGVKQAVVAGSYRRRKETVGDLDILVTCSAGSPVMDRFVRYDEVAEIVSKGNTRASVILHNGLHVDLRVVPAVSYGAALHYFTGAKAHNIAVRARAVKRGLKLNEYGVFRKDKRIAGRTEEEVFEEVGLPYIEPELREDWGEIEAAQDGKLPQLVTLEDIRGDLHAHTKATDGRHTIEEMAEAAGKRGYDYLAISDHTRHVAVAHGQDARRLARQIRRIDKLNERLGGLKIIKSAEVDILADGSLDLPDGILKELDFVVCAVHYKFNLSAEEQTERIVRAMDSRFFDVLAHPTGRLIGERAAYEVDMERLMLAAGERGCFLELNAQPERLDLTDVHCKMAKELGVKVVISTDAHSVTGLDCMRFGVAQARRGWLEPGDVLNTRPWTEVRSLLRRR